MRCHKSKKTNCLLIWDENSLFWFLHLSIFGYQGSKEPFLESVIYVQLQRKKHRRLETLWEDKRMFSSCDKVQVKLRFWAIFSLNSWIKIIIINFLRAANVVNNREISYRLITEKINNFLLNNKKISWVKFLQIVFFCYSVRENVCKSFSLDQSNFFRFFMEYFTIKTYLFDNIFFI